jgi:hypothetical protein
MERDGQALGAHGTMAGQKETHTNGPKMNLMLPCLLAASLISLAAAAQSAPLTAVPAGQKPVIVNMAADAVVNFVLHKIEKPFGKGATREMALAALDKEVDQYQGAGVSHLFWNVNYQRVGYNSAAWPSYWDMPDPEKQVTEWPRTYYELHKLGIDDVFARLIPRCRERGLSPWVSLRMNDHHYSSDPSRVSPLFFEHPELRLHKGKGLFNYARPEVREHYLKLVAEVLQRYDVDGLELDWIRTPSNFEDSEINTSGRVILTEFVREVRRQTQAAGQRLGHPVRLAVRVPATPELSLGKGFDTVAWAREGLLDMIIPSDWWSGYNDTPVEAWRAEIGPGARSCQIVPGTASTYACAAKGFMMYRNLAGMRGFAASMFDRGADGLYLFNHFEPVDWKNRLRTPDGKSTNDCTVAELLHAAGDCAGAANFPRIHALAIHDCLPLKGDYRPALPAALAPQQPVTLKLHTGPQPATGSYVVRVGLDKTNDLASVKLAVRLNGQACRALDDLPLPAKPDPRLEQPRLNVCEVAPRVLQFEALLPAVVRGYNAIELSVLQGGPQTVIWLDVAIDPSAGKESATRMP